VINPPIPAWWEVLGVDPASSMDDIARAFESQPRTLERVNAYDRARLQFKIVDDFLSRDIE
jgi:hypothetical protein